MTPQCGLNDTSFQTFAESRGAPITQIMRRFYDTFAHRGVLSLTPLIDHTVNEANGSAIFESNFIPLEAVVQANSSMLHKT